jgi:hypothetical protein
MDVPLSGRVFCLLSLSFVTVGTLGSGIGRKGAGTGYIIGGGTTIMMGSLGGSSSCELDISKSDNFVDSNIV